MILVRVGLETKKSDRTTGENNRGNSTPTQFQASPEAFLVPPAHMENQAKGGKTEYMQTPKRGRVTEGEGE